MKQLVVLGLSLSSSWGNGHATTYRALLRGVAAHGCATLFLERNTPWYAQHRDLLVPDFCELAFYDSLEDLSRFADRIANADAVIVGSYVPDGVAVIDTILATARGIRVFYDIDTPITLAALENGDAAYLARRQIPLLDLYLSFSGGPVPDKLQREYGCRLARPFYCSVDPALYFPVDVARRWDLGYLGTYSADRQPALQRLLIEPAERLPGCRFVVAGSQYPANLNWPPNVERIAHLPPDQHPAFYCAQRLTLNVTRSDMVAAGWSPSVRLFEAAACGTPIISDRWAGLTDLLPERSAVLIAETADDVVTMLTAAVTALQPSSAVKARQIVLASHTGVARAEELFSFINQAGKRRPQRNGSFFPPGPAMSLPCFC